MKITQQFTVARPLPIVWAFFKDIPNVARCLPGAEYLGPKGDGRHAGKVTSKIGPFQASFEGEADVFYDDVQKSVHADGKGVDKKGASRGKMVLDCQLAPEGDSTNVVVNADIQLSGTIAQFGRTGLITEVANLLIKDFVRNAETAMSASDAPSQEDVLPTPQADPPASSPIGGFALLLMSLRGLFKRWFGRAN